MFGFWLLICFWHCSLLLLVLKNIFNINGSSLSWIISYLSDRFVYVSLNHSTSSPPTSAYGVSQGSFYTSHLLFILSVSELSNIISSHNLNSLSYADDSRDVVKTFFARPSLRSRLFSQDQGQDYDFYHQDQVQDQDFFFKTIIKTFFSRLWKKLQF